MPSSAKSAWLPTFAIDQYWSITPFIAPRPNLAERDARFDTNIRNCIIYCDGSCGEKFCFDGVKFDGSYAFIPEEVSLCTSWAEAIRHLYALYHHRYWNATWLCSSCWQHAYFQQDAEVFTLDEVRYRLSHVHPEFQSLMRHDKLSQELSN